VTKSTRRRLRDLPPPPLLQKLERIKSMVMVVVNVASVVSSSMRLYIDEDAIDSAVLFAQQAVDQLNHHRYRHQVHHPRQHYHRPSLPGADCLRRARPNVQIFILHTIVVENARRD
jgi:hypothetical protein